MDVVSREEHDRIVAELRGEIEALKARPEPDLSEIERLRARVAQLEATLNRAEPL